MPSRKELDALIQSRIDALKSDPEVRLVPMTLDQRNAIADRIGGQPYEPFEAEFAALPDAWDAAPADPAEAVARAIHAPYYDRNKTLLVSKALEALGMPRVSRSPAPEEDS